MIFEWCPGRAGEQQGHEREAYQDLRAVGYSMAGVLLSQSRQLLIEEVADAEDLQQAPADRPVWGHHICAFSVRHAADVAIQANSGGVAALPDDLGNDLVIQAGPFNSQGEGR